MHDPLWPAGLGLNSARHHYDYSLSPVSFPFPPLVPWNLARVGPSERSFCLGLLPVDPAHRLALWNWLERTLSPRPTPDIHVPSENMLGSISTPTMKGPNPITLGPPWPFRVWPIFFPFFFFLRKRIQCASYILHKAQVSLRVSFNYVCAWEVAHLDACVHALGGQRYWVP